MAVIVTEDLVEGAKLELTAEGYRAERVFHVAGLTGTSSAKVLAALDNAAIPNRGDAHPDISGIQAWHHEARALTDERVEIRVVYHRPTYGSSQPDDESQIIVGTSLQQTLVHEDIYGDLIVCEYTPSGSGASVIYQPVKASKLAPRSSITFIRREYESPANKSADYTEKVNEAGWDFDPQAGPYTWLCTGIKGRSTDGGATYMVTYTFLYNGTAPTYNWDALVEYVDPATGKPPGGPIDGLVDGVGRKIVPIYLAANFNDLDLP